MVKHLRVREPGLDRFLWLSALLHVCAVIGLTLLWGQRERGGPSPPSAPLRVSLIYSEMGGAAGEGFVEGQGVEYPSDHRRAGDEARPPAPGASSGSDVAADSAGDRPAPPQSAAIGAGPPMPQSPSKRVRPAPPSATTATRTPSSLTLPLPSSQRQSADRQLATGDKPASQPSTPPQNDTQEPDSRETSTTTPALAVQERGISRLPRLSDEDLEKFAQLPYPEGRGMGRPFGGVDTAISLNTTETKYLSYFTHLKQKIDRVWRYPVEATAQGIHGQLLLLFVLRRSGQVSRVELLRSSGSKVLDKEAWEAVLNASPFDPFPPQIPEEELRIRARFTYVLEAASQRTRVH